MVVMLLPPLLYPPLASDRTVQFALVLDIGSDQLEYNYVGRKTMW